MATAEEILQAVNGLKDYFEDEPIIAIDGLPSYDDLADRRRFILLTNRLYLVEKYVLEIKDRLDTLQLTGGATASQVEAIVSAQLKKTKLTQ